MSSHPQVHTHSWRLVLAVACQHFWKSAALFVAIIALTVAVIVYAPRKYHSTAQYLVRLGHESVSLDPVATVGETMGLHMTSDSVVRSTREIIASQALAEKVVARLGADVVLDRDPHVTPTLLASAKLAIQALDPISLDEKARITLQKNLSVSSPNQSNVIVVSYFATSPQLAHQIMQVVSEVFLEEHNRINRTEGSFEFFVEQNKVLGDELKLATEALRAAKQEYRISSIEGRRSNLEGRLTETQSSASENERSLASTLSKIQQLTEQLSTTPEDIVLGATSGVNQQTAAALRQQLYDLQIREKELLSKYTADHPNLISVQKQLQEVSDIFTALNLSDTATSRGVNPIHQGLSIQLLTERANLASLEAAKEVLAQQIGALMTELDALNGQENEIFHLQTQLDVAKGKYETHAAKLEQARLEYELGTKQITSIGVIQSPALNERPVSPNKLIVCVLGFAAACFTSLTLPFALEYLRDDVRSLPAIGLDAPPAFSMLRQPVTASVDEPFDEEAEWASGKL